MISDDPIKQAYSSVGRITNLLIGVVVLGLTIGLLSSAIVSLLQPKSYFLVALVAFSALGTILMLLRVVRFELALKSI